MLGCSADVETSASSREDTFFVPLGVGVELVLFREAASWWGTTWATVLTPVFIRWNISSKGAGEAEGEGGVVRPYAGGEREVGVADHGSDEWECESVVELYRSAERVDERSGEDG